MTVFQELYRQKNLLKIATLKQKIIFMIIGEIYKKNLCLISLKVRQKQAQLQKLIFLQTMFMTL